MEQTITTAEGKVDRVAEGRRIFSERGAEIKSLGAERFEVPSRSLRGRRRYVDLGIQACSCPDSQQRGETCAHMIAATLAAAKPAPRAKTGSGWVPFTEERKARVLAWLDEAEETGRL